VGRPSWFAYHAVPVNGLSLRLFRDGVIWHWRCAPRRRGQCDRTSWKAISTARPPSRLSQRPPPHIQGGAACLNRARTVLCGGRAVMRVPTAMPFLHADPQNYGTTTQTLHLQNFNLAPFKLLSAESGIGAFSNPLSPGKWAPTMRCPQLVFKSIALKVRDGRVPAR